MWRFRGQEGLIEEWVHGHSRAIVQDPFIFVTSTTGFDYVRMSIAEDALTQTRDAWGIISSVLMQSDSDLSEIVQCRYFLSRRRDLETVMRESKTILEGVLPAITLVVLPQLPHPRARVAIEVTAMWGARAAGYPTSQIHS